MARPRLKKPRTPTGQISRASGVREAAVDPATIRRLVDAAASSARMETWGTVHGRLFLDGKLTEKQFAACKLWAELARDYRAAIAIREPKSSMAVIDAAGGTPPDPDSKVGAKMGDRERRIIAKYETARDKIVADVGKVKYQDFVGAVECHNPRDFPFAEASAVRKCAAYLVDLWEM